MTEIEQLRERIKETQVKRDKAVMEKGLAGQDNKDLRENYYYIYWEEQEFILNSKIRDLMKQIQEIDLKNKPTKKSKGSVKKVEKLRIKPHKWL